MNKFNTAAFGLFSAAALLVAAPAIAGQVTIPQWGTNISLGASEQAGPGPVTCALPVAGNAAETVNVIAQSADDCTAVGGISQTKS